MADKPEKPKKRAYTTPRLRTAVAGHIATEIRDKISPAIHVAWHTAVASGKEPFLDIDEGGELVVITYDRGGMAPNLDQRTRSMVWLAERGYGLPAQSIQVEQTLRIDQRAPTIKAGQLLTPERLRALRGVLGLLGTANPEGDQRESEPAQREPAAIDVEWKDVKEPALDDQRDAELEPELEPASEEK